MDDSAEKDCFKKGAKVEVSFEEEGFRGSWYTGTVIRTLSKKTNKIYLEFDTLDQPEQPGIPHREHVPIILVRPVPPRDPIPTFRLSDEVDAFHRDGWWEGVVTAVHPPSSPTSSSTYSVFFRSCREQLQFPVSDLRLHREWVYGKWVPPLELQPPTTTPRDHDNAQSKSNRQQS